MPHSLTPSQPIVTCCFRAQSDRIPAGLGPRGFVCLLLNSRGCVKHRLSPSLTTLVSVSRMGLGWSSAFLATSGDERSRQTTESMVGSGTRRGELGGSGSEHGVWSPMAGTSNTVCSVKRRQASGGPVRATEARPASAQG